MNNNVNDIMMVKTIFNTIIAEDFTTMKDVLENALKDEGYNEKDFATGEEELPANIKLLIDSSSQSPIPKRYIENPKRRDTSIGGNNTINCYPQFHENDDLVYPYNAVTPDGNNGLGRVYNETIDNNQQIMHLSFGVAQFNDPTVFYTTAINQQLSQLMNKGDAWSVANIAGLLGKVVGFVISVPLKPFIWTHKLVTGWFSRNATRYYDFKPTMPLYYKVVNTSIAILSVNMGLSEVENEYVPEDENTTSTQSAQSNSDVNEVDENGKDNSNSHGLTRKGLPSAFTSAGLDIFAILHKTDIYDKLITSGEIWPLDKEIEKLKKQGSGIFGIFRKFFSGFASAITESKMYIGVKIEKSVDSSESYSNSVGPSSISESVNSKVAAVKDTTYTAGDFNVIGLKTIKDSMVAFLDNVTSNFGVSGIAEAMKGNGFLDFPEVWKNSSFSKSYSFTMQLRSIYGDRVSILYNIYIPLLMMFSAALPRAVGKHAYTSPFLVRAYSKGLFSVPLGIIDSMSVKRGSSEFGWSSDGFPTSVDISFTIKDLSAAMYMGVAGTDSWLDVLGQNSSFNEYLLNLGGVSIIDRTDFGPTLKRKTKILNLISRNVKFNPNLLGFSYGTNSFLGNVLTRISPIGKLPK